MRKIEDTINNHKAIFVCKLTTQTERNKNGRGDKAEQRNKKKGNEGKRGTKEEVKSGH